MLVTALTIVPTVHAHISVGGFLKKHGFLPGTIYCSDVCSKTLTGD